MLQTTLCYIEREDAWLMLHRTKKKDDVNAGKWIGVGGKLEAAETPEECLLREIREETGLTVVNYRYRGMLTFLYSDKEPEYIYTYTAEAPDGAFIPCSEGELKWIPKSEVPELNLWEGDRYLIKYLLEDRKEPFSLKLCYDEKDELTEAWEMSWPAVRLK